MDPLVSIGIPTYNRGTQLENIVHTALDQTYKNLQVIVVDNNSSDLSAQQALENISGLNDTRLEIYRNYTNLGVLKNAYECLRYAKGKYFTWFSDDDWRSPTFIECLVDVLESNSDYGFAISEYRDIVDISLPSLLHLRSRKKLFHTFSSHNKYRRIYSFFLSDHALGKCNLFYSVFHTSRLKDICFRKVSCNWTNLAMDRNLSFLYLKKNRLYFAEDTLIALKVKNLKNYSIDTGFSSSIKEFINEILFTCSNVDSQLERLFILILTPLKAWVTFRSRIFLKLYRLYKRTKLIPARNRELNALKKISTSNNKPDKSKLSLHDLTIVCIATRNVEKGAAALAYSLSSINFGKAILFSHYKPWNLSPKIQHCQINPFNSVEEWGYFVIYQLYQYIDTSHILLIHPDGFVVNPDSWCDDYLKYDYIGAPWLFPKDNYSYRSKSGKIVRVGNSVSIRSLAILKAPTSLGLKWESYFGFYHEDGFLCAQYYDFLSDHGFTYAPIEVAYKFSVERELPDQPNNMNSFVFHDWIAKNQSYPRLSDY